MFSEGVKGRRCCALCQRPTAEPASLNPSRPPRPPPCLVRVSSGHTVTPSGWARTPPSVTRTGSRASTWRSWRRSGHWWGSGSPSPAGRRSTGCPGPKPRNERSCREKQEERHFNKELEMQEGSNPQIDDQGRWHSSWARHLQSHWTSLQRAFYLLNLIYCYCQLFQ